jgi:PAS domain S-box-containing protein
MLKRSISDGIICSDDQGKIAFFSQGAEHILGYSREEVIGQPLAGILVPEESSDLEVEIPPLAGCAEHYTLLNKQGDGTNIHIFNASIALASPAPPGMILLLREMSESETTDDLRSNFLGSISQEFRTPLAAINASVELLLEELERLSTDELSALLNSIHISVAGLQTLIDNLIESMNIEADQFRIHKQPTDLQQVISGATQIVKPLLCRREQKLNLQIPEELPWIQGDSGRLMQVIVNLLSNASKYSPIGKPIDLSVSEQQKCIQVTVADRGSGIPPNERRAIFRRFVQTGSLEEPQYGIGLGLSVVKAIIEGHGGEVGFDSREGGGSVFWLKLPYNTPRNL